MTKVSIVCAYNTQIEMTIEFLDNLVETTKYEDIDIECILVHGLVGDEGDIEHPFVTKYTYIINTGFCNTLNEGLRLVADNSDYVFMIGNDSFPSDEDWLTRLVKAAEETKAKLINPCDQHTRRVRPDMFLTDDKYYKCSFLPSVAWFFPKEVLDTVGLLDEDFTGAGYYADNDYCNRIVQKYGKDQVVLIKDLVMEHRCSVEGKVLGVTNQMSQLHEVYKRKWN